MRSSFFVGAIISSSSHRAVGEPTLAVHYRSPLCLSSYYRFLTRTGLVTANPCDLVERPRHNPSPARGYSADEVRRLLAVIPDTIQGRRDRAILLVFILTGRRRTEVMDLTAGDIEVESGAVFYRVRGKGGKRGRRELPRPAWEAVRLTPNPPKR